MADLPATEVSVDVKKTPDGAADAVDISLTRGDRAAPGGTREPNRRNYIGSGPTVGRAFKDAVEKMLGDPRTGEFLP